VEFNQPVWDGHYYSEKRRIVLDDDVLAYTLNYKTCNNLLLDSVITISNTYAEGNLLFNEVLFNSNDDCPEFIELVNHSDSYIKLDKVYLGYTVSGVYADDIFALPNNLLIPPHSYVVLCDDFKQLSLFYEINPYCVQIEMKLPSLSNTEGVLILLSDVETIGFNYNGNQHNELLNDNKGVSLERVNWRTNKWTSGNYSTGKASVGFQNSAFSINEEGKIKMSLNRKHFSLSKRESLKLEIEFEDGDYWGNISLMKLNGVEAQTLYENHHFSASVELPIDELITIDDVGFYLIFFDFIHPEKGKITKRLSLVIIE
jgi:hypothetical protein